MGSIPGEGTKIPQAAGQLSPRATTTEPARLNERERKNPHATTREKPTREKPVGRSERSRMPEQRSCMSQLRPDAAKKKKLEMMKLTEEGRLKAEIGR